MLALSVNSLKTMRLYRHIIYTLCIVVITTIANSEDIKSKLEGKVYSKFDEFVNNIGEGIAENLRDNENLKYLDFSVNLHEGFSPSYEIQTVNKLIEYKDGALFNQTNLRSHSGETTLNFGVGKRKLLNDDTFLLGSNLFLDYQFDESHLRYGVGLEAISNTLDLIGNYYNAISGFKGTDSGREKVLDGYDVQLNYHILNKTKTDLFVQLFEWENPNSTYEEKGEKFGLNTMFGNLALQIGYTNDNKNNDGLFGSIKLVVPLGKEKNTNNSNGSDNNINSLSVRNKLYAPVQRENKIKVVKISKSGVKISGF